MGSESTAAALPLPKYLLSNKEQILIISGQAEKGAEYTPEEWKKLFKGNDLVLGDLEKVFSAYPLRIRRDNIEQFVNQAIDGSCNVRIPFLATMIWGWNKFRDRGASNIQKCYSVKNLEDTLNNAITSIRAGDIRTAYDEFKVSGCGPAFFTKFFYFIGRACDIKPLPLILDKQVAKYLEQICGQEGWALNRFVAVNRDDRERITDVKSDVDGYLRYVNSLNSWAKELGCSAEKIELFMYKGKGNLGEQDGDLNKPLETTKSYSDKEQNMSQAFPLKETKSFAKKESLQDISDIIEKYCRQPKDERNYIPKGMWAEHFRRNNYLDKFISERWKFGGTEDGQKYLGKYNKKAQLFYKYLPGGNPKSQPLPTEARALNIHALQIQLTQEQMSKMGNVAKDFGVNIDMLAKIWICERLSILNTR